MPKLALLFLSGLLCSFVDLGARASATPLIQLQASAPKTVTVEMYEVGPDKWIFEPASVTINAGDTVLWKNTDRVGHTSTSDDRLWDSDALDPGESYSFTFRETGKYGYFCAYHAGMVGEVVVVAAPAPTATAKPMATREPTAAPTATDTPRPAPTRTPPPTPTMSPTEASSPTARPTSAPTATVELTAAPEPTPTEITAPAFTPTPAPSIVGAEGDNRGAGLTLALGGALLLAAGVLAYRLLQN